MQHDASDHFMRGLARDIHFATAFIFLALAGVIWVGYVSDQLIVFDGAYKHVNAIALYQYAAIVSLFFAAGAFYRQRARFTSLYGDISLHIWRADDRSALPVESLDDMPYLVRAVRAWPTRIATRFGFIYAAIAGIQVAFAHAAQTERFFHTGIALAGGLALIPAAILFMSALSLASYCDIEPEAKEFMPKALKPFVDMTSTYDVSKATASDKRP